MSKDDDTQEHDRASPPLRRSERGRAAADGTAIWADCPHCGGEGIDTGRCTCMDDTCCCLVPEPAACSVCGGNGGWHDLPEAN